MQIAVSTWSIMGISPIARARRKVPGSTGSCSKYKFWFLIQLKFRWKNEDKHFCKISEIISFKCCYLHQNQNIHWIAVFTNGSWDKPVVVWVDNWWVKNTINLRYLAHELVMLRYKQIKDSKLETIALLSMNSKAANDLL